MTGKEMTELFAIMLLAWPNAETFKGGIPKLAPTIKLWVSCTADVDFWTGQQAVVRLCQHCKFPPTIAEFREQVDNVNKDIKRLTDQAFQEIRSANTMYESLTAFYTELPRGTLHGLLLTLWVASMPCPALGQTTAGKSVQCGSYGKSRTPAG